MAGDPGRRARLLVLGAGAAQAGLLAAARARGIYVVAADRDPSAPGFAYADRRALVSTEDETGLERLAEAERVDGIVAPGIDWPVAIAARIAARLGLPHPISPETAVLATSKLRQRARLDEAGVPQPRWRVATEPDDSLGFPCVVKAPDRQGQRGLSLVRSRDELRAAVAEAVEASRGRSYLVEELVDGPEVTVNGFSAGGRYTALTVTDRIVAEPPAFGVALAHAWPAEATGADAAADVARAAVEALGIEDGPTYVQLRIGSDGPKVVEVAARLGGGHDAELCRAALGVDLLGLTLAAALGEPHDPVFDAAGSRTTARGACVRFLVPPPGRLVAVDGLEAARAVDGVVDVRVYRSPGHVFGPLRHGADRAGAVIATGATRAKALERTALAGSLVRFTTADGEPDS